MLSAYHGEIMDAKVGHRYRDLILTHGSERKASDMVRDFLKREPSPAAFFAEITGQRHD
jgi:thimet oligopeptidase